MKAELYINRMHGAQDGNVVRVVIRQGRHIIVRAELPLADFASAIMGAGAVPIDVQQLDDEV